MVKAQVEGFRCVRGRSGRTGDAKATGDSKYQLGIIYGFGFDNSFSLTKYRIRASCQQFGSFMA